jgi:hypothetical protein
VSGESYGGSYGDHKPAGQETAFERDRRIEAGYDFPREDDVSVLQYVAQNQEELAREFFEWRTGSRDGSALDALGRWEVIRFGGRLFESAHRLIWFRVRALMLPAAALPPKREITRPVLSDSERLRRFDEAAGRLAREKAMPAVKEAV